MRDHFRLLPFYACALAFIWSVQNDPFFWDTVQLASKHAHHFYSNGLRWTPLPAETDSGHPPVFGFYLATIWTYFGKTLPASHWAMLPFLLLNVWLIYRIGRRIGGERWAFMLLPLVLLDPVVAGQQALVSPDVALTSGFLFAILGILESRFVVIMLGITILCMASIRGMMTAGGLFACQALHGVLFCREKAISRPFLRSMALKIAPFLPGFVFAAWFLWWHKVQTGWSGYHPGSPWAPAFAIADGQQMLKNLAVVGWRWLDFGRVFEWLFAFWLIYKAGGIKKFGQALHPGLKKLLLLLLCLVVFLSPSAVLFQNISAHRYFLPGFLAFHFVVFQLLTNGARWTINDGRWTADKGRWAMTFLTIALALGNFWIYPRGISMGWAATLALLPYHRLREDAVKFLEQEKIDFGLVGSAFPNLNTGENLMLNGDPRRFAEKDFARNQFMFASNVFNDFSENDYNQLENNWLLIKHFEHAGVWIDLYRKPG